jgi:hypothetical protein
MKIRTIIALAASLLLGNDGAAHYPGKVPTPNADLAALFPHKPPNPKKHRLVRPPLVRPKREGAAKLSTAGTPPTRGFIDVSQFGCTPGGADCGPALRTIISGLDGTGATLHFGPGDWWVFDQEPLLFNSNRTAVEGAGQNLTRVHAPWSTFFLGMADVQYGKVLDASYRPPAVALDQSCHGLYAYKTKGDTVLHFASHPFNNGPVAANARGYAGWQGFTEFTLAFCIGPSDSGAIPVGIVPFSVGPWNDTTFWVGMVAGPRPDTLDVAVLYRLPADDQPDATSQPFRRFDFVIPANQVNRIQIWKDAAGFGALANGVPVACYGSVSAPSSLLGDWGRYGATVNGEGIPTGTSVPDWVLYGLCLSNKAIKVWQTNDFVRYFDDKNPATVTFVSGTLPRYSLRWVATADGPAGGNPGYPGATKGGWIWSTTGPRPSQVPTTTGGVTMTDMTLYGAPTAVGIGQVLDGRFENMAVYAEVDAFSCTGYDCAYPLLFRKLTVGGDRGGGFNLWNTTNTTLENIQIQNHGRTGIRITSSDVYIRDVLFSAWDPNSTRAEVVSLGGDYGTSVEVRDLDIDTEGPVTAMECVIYAQQQFIAPGGLRVRNVGISSSPKTFLKLRRLSSGWPPSKVEAGRLLTLGPGLQEAVRVDGAGGWVGTVDVSQLPVHTVTGTGSSSITVITK